MRNSSYVIYRAQFLVLNNRRLITKFFRVFIIAYLNLDNKLTANYSRNDLSQSLVLDVKLMLSEIY